MKPSLEHQYGWLPACNPPRVIQEALALYGTREIEGEKHNPVILDWAREVGIKGYNADEVPWCGLFAAVVVKRAGFAVVAGPLWARGWAAFGQAADRASLGDVLVFARGSGGHVGFYVAEDAKAYHVLGGNQGNAVSITRISKDRLIATRRPLWKVSQPASVKPRWVEATGALSRDEA